MPCSARCGLVFLLKLIWAFLLRNIYLCHLPHRTNTHLRVGDFFSPLFNQIPVRYFTGMTDTDLLCVGFFSFSLFNQILLCYFTGRTVSFSIVFLLELCLERWCRKQIKELLDRPPVVFFHSCCTPSLYLARSSHAVDLCTHAISVNTQPHCLTVR